MKNDKGSVGIVLIIVVAVAILGFGSYKVLYKEAAPEPADQNPTIGNFPANYEPAIHQVITQANTSEKGKCGLVVENVSANASVNFPITLKGKIYNTGCSWQIFEGEAGAAQLYFKSSSGWNKLGLAMPVSVPDWEASLNDFYVTLDFNNGGVGLSKGTEMKVVFTESNAKDESVSKTLEFPLIYSGHTATNLDWKTYKNDKYSFSFEYPSGFGDSSQYPSVASQIDCSREAYSEVGLAEAKNLSIGLSCNSVVGKVQKVSATIAGLPGYYSTSVTSTGYNNIAMYVPLSEKVHVKVSHSYKTGLPVEYLQISSKEFQHIMTTFKFICSNGAPNYPHCNAN